VDAIFGTCTVWHILTNDVDYTDPGDEHFLTRTNRDRQTRRLIIQLHQPGYQVRLEPAA